MTIIDHKVAYRERLLHQYKHSTNLLGLIDALIEGQGDLEVVLDNLLTQRGIDTAVGAQLDIIGEIVGQPRTILDTTGLEFFAYNGAAGDVDGYGSNTDPTAGARYKGATEEVGTFRELSDPEYRIFIKARIFKNVGFLTTNDLIDAIVFMFGEGTLVSVVEDGNANVTLTIAGLVTSATAKLLDTNDAFPRPVGVSYSILFSAGDGKIFAFAGFAGGSTFGTVNDPVVGGIFAEII